jgi:beta-hydroxylase
VNIPKPETQCGIVVGGELAHWQNGRSLVFDDSHLHYAWNRSEHDRVVLFVDFERPLPRPLSLQNSRVIDLIGESDFITAAARNWQKWESKYGDLLDQSLNEPLTNYY